MSEACTIGRSQPTPPAISKLPEEILWHTISFLAQGAQPSHTTQRYIRHSDPFALDYLRQASQICVSWRTLVLASSSLWGMAIDFGCLSQKTSHWRDEVLRRTGKSLLDIQGSVAFDADDGFKCFLASLLNDHWSRIRKLHIRFDNFDPIQPFLMESMHRAFQRPALYLEYFWVGFRGHSADFLSTPFRLFEEQAPVLRHFTGPCFRICLPTPWISKLRVLDFACQCNVRELLNALARMPFLEILGIATDDDEIDLSVIGKACLPRVRLPRLTDLRVDTGRALTKPLAILEHLVPAVGFHFNLVTDDLPLLPSNHATAQRVLCSYLQLAFKEELPCDLQLFMNKRCIVIHMSRFSFNYEIEFEEDFPDISIFLQPLASISFTHTTKLTLQIPNDVLAPTDIPFMRTMKSLASVEELTITSNSLQLLLSLPTVDGSILFPSLKILQLDGGCEKDLIIDFLTQRIAQDAPIHVLDFYFYKWPLTLDFSSLEQFDGLKVLWRPAHHESKVDEYICGSGHPDVLNITVA